MAEILAERNVEDIYPIKNHDKVMTLSSFFTPKKKRFVELKPNLKKKKRVTIKKDIDIINIEDWKKFNIDVSISGGCPEWDNHCMINYEDDIYEFENEICNIF